MRTIQHQLRIHVPVEFGINVLPPTWREHVTYGLGTGLELRWSQPRELRSRIREARWAELLAPTYNHDCFTSAWDLWAIGSLCLLSSKATRERDVQATDALFAQAKIPHGYCKYIGAVVEGSNAAHQAKFKSAPSADACAGIGAAALALVIVNHVNLSGSASDPHVVEQLAWLRMLTAAAGRASLVPELEAHWRSGELNEPTKIERALERLSSRA
jgi:hypothetical protein